MKTVFKNSIYINSVRLHSSAFILPISTKCHTIFAAAFLVTVHNVLSQIYAHVSTIDMEPHGH